MSRPSIPISTITDVLVRSRRRCAFCFGLSHQNAVVKGQIAHIDRNPANHDRENLVWLCLDHHDQYDSKTSQSKGFVSTELRHYRDDLYQFNQDARRRLEPSSSYTFLSSEGTALAQYFSATSLNGHKFDPQARIETLPSLLGLTEEDVELAIDELHELGYLEINGSRDVVFPTNRLFWETDALFTEADPAVDAQDVARFVVAHANDYTDLQEIAEALKWPARRVNPAATYLIDSGVVGERAALGTAPYWVLSLIRTPRTRRYVRDVHTSPDPA